MDRLRLAVVGVGHLGKEHARVLAGLPGVELTGVADTRPEQAEAVARRCGTRAFPDYRPLLDEADAAVIAVPTVHHHEVARAFLRRGIPLLVEKPLANTLEEADELVALARKSGALLQVGHVERFNPAYEELRRRFSQPKFVSCQRLSPFTGRSLDIGVVLDLMIHDLDLLLDLVAAPVREASALGASLLGGHEDLVQARLTFANGCVAHLAASRVHTGPLRRMEVWSARGLACADFHARRVSVVQPADRLRQLRLHPLDAATVSALRADLHGSYLQHSEIDCDTGGADQLTRELQEFVRAVRTGSPVRVPGEQGREALAVAGRILASLRVHAWNGHAAGPVGPLDLPAPGSPPLPSREREAA